MVTPEDIKLLAASGEGYNAEFKVSVPSKVKDITEEVCAFANAAGGVVLIGINDQNQIVGASFDNAKRSAIQSSLNEVSPRSPAHYRLLRSIVKALGLSRFHQGQRNPTFFQDPSLFALVQIPKS